MHYYKFNISDWGLATSHLSLEEEAIYFRLINYYYDTEKPIPLEMRVVTRRLRLTGSEEMVADILGEYFVKNDDGWLHARCEKDLKEFRKTARKNKSNGAKGGRPSNGVTSKVTQTKPTGLPNETQTKGNHKPLTINHKPQTKDTRGKKEKRFLPPSLIEVSSYFIERNGRNEAQQFIDFYESKGWMVGKNKMKSWEAAVRNWIQRQTVDKQTTRDTTLADDFLDTSWARAD